MYMKHLVQSRYSISKCFYFQVISIFSYSHSTFFKIALEKSVTHTWSSSIPRKLLSCHFITSMCSNPQISQRKEGQLKQVYVFLEYNLGKCHAYHQVCLPAGEFYILKQKNLNSKLWINYCYLKCFFKVMGFLSLPMNKNTR